MQLTNLIKLRKKLKAAGHNISVNDVVLKAVGVALGKVPDMNVYFNSETGKVHC